MELGLARLPQVDLDYVVERVSVDAEPLNGSRIAVTGASGFVGTWLVASLCELRRRQEISDMEIVVIVRNPETARLRLGDEIWKVVEPVVADVRAGIPALGNVSHAIHGATPSSLRSGSHDQRGVLVTSVVGTNNLVKALGDAHRRPRVLNLSSGAVYGPQPPDLPRLPETYTGGPTPDLHTSPYAEGKRSTESLLENAGREGLITPIQARLFAFLGPMLPTNEGFAIGNFIQDAAQERTVRVLGDGSTVRSYLNARDLATWLIRLLTLAPSGKPYNVGSPHARSLREWAALCAELAGTDVSVGDRKLGERSLYIPDVSNSAELGLCSDVEDPVPALRSWLTWLRVQPQES